MASSNIELFDEFAGKIFGQLYERFPVPKDLHIEDFFPTISKEGGDAAASEISHKRTVFYATTVWLQSAGYTTSADERSSFSNQVVLTAKGLEVLKATPRSLTIGPSIGEQLAEATKEGGKEIMRGLVSEALGIGARLFNPLVGLSS